MVSFKLLSNILLGEREGKGGYTGGNKGTGMSMHFPPPWGQALDRPYLTLSTQQPKTGRAGWLNKTTTEPQSLPVNCACAFDIGTCEAQKEN